MIAAKLTPLQKFFKVLLILLLSKGIEFNELLFDRE